MGNVKLAFAAAALALACSGTASDRAEPIAESLAPLDQSCANAAPVATLELSNYVSPRTYNPRDCFKGVVVEVTPPPGSSDWVVQVRWADDVPTNQSDCEAIWLGGYRFDANSSGGWTMSDFISLRGIWSENTCYYPIWYFNGVQHTKFAFSARAAQTIQAPTRMLGVSRL